MNKFFKRLALLLAVLMIVSMMPVQLFADNSVIVEGQSNGTGENGTGENSYLTISGIAGFEGRQFASFADAYTAIKPVLERLCAGDALGQGVATAEAFDALFTNRDENGNATLTYTISGNIVYDETGYANLLTMGRRASHYGNDRHLINFKFVGATGKEADTLTVNSNITLPYEWWGEKTVTSISFENLTITGSAPSGLYPSQPYFDEINFKVDNCNLKGIKIYNTSNVKGTYTITNSTLDGTGAPADAYAIHLQGNKTEPLTINISGNTISGYDRGINIDQNTANATISGNTISIKDAGRSCIQLSRLANVAIANNTLELTGGNAITLHELLLGMPTVPEITVKGNTITGNGYLIYDDAVANNKAFTSENLTLTIGTNTVASTVDTKQGVKGSNKYGISETVATVVNEALKPAYVATVNGVGYTSLAEAIANATPDANGVITYEISGKATVDSTGWIQVARAGLAGLTKVEFVGKTSDAEICITGGLAILADQNYDIDVSFKALTLSKPNPAYGGDYGHSTNYFTTWLRNTNAAENTVTYTNCTFPNGACNNQYGKTVFDGCKFTNATSGKYNFWNYGGNTEIKNSTFTGVRGIKTYNEGTLAVAPTVKIENTTFDGLTEKAAIVTSKATDITLDNVSATKCTKGFFQKDIENSGEKTTIEANGSAISGNFNITAEKGAAAAKEEFNISGGTFTSEVSSDYLADGFELKKNIDGTYGVKAGKYVAQIGDVKYETLAAALAAAKRKSTVTLLADTCENVTISTPYVTLDLNGFTLNGSTGERKPALTITARVTVMDSSATQTGTIMREDTAENSGVSSHYVIDIQGSGWLTFESGTVKNNSGSAAGKGASLVRVGNDSVAKYPGLNIKGGTFTQDNFIVIKVDSGDLFLNGGTLNSANSYAIENWHRATIKGGTVNGTAAAWTYSGGLNSTLEISGGTVNGDVESISYDGTAGKKASVSITGGTVNGTLSTKRYDSATEPSKEMATIEVTGGTFTKDPTKYVIEDSAITKNADGTFGVAKAYLAKVGENFYYTMDEAFKAQTASGEPIVLLRDYTTGSTFNSGTVARTVDLNGHTWTCTGKDANSAAFEINNANASLTVKNGKIVSSQLVGLIPSAMGGTIKYDNSSLTFENVEMSTTATSGIETNGNNTNDTVTLKNSTLNVPNGFGIYFPSSGTLTVENSKITAKTMGVQVCSGVLIISGADTAITVTGDAVPKTEDDGAIQDGAAISIVNRTGYKGLDTVTISGGKFTAKEGNSAIKAYDWANKTESDFTADKGTVAVSGGTFSSAVPADLCAEGLVPVANTDGTYGVKTGKYVAQIGDAKYETLADALAAAKDGDTVKLLDNVDLTETLIIKDKTITLDLNGKTISNSTDIWNESIYAWSLISVRDNGDLTIDDTVGGGTLKAKENDCFTLDVYAYDTKNVENTKLTINAGNYVGNISAVYAFTGKVTINGGHFSIQQKESGSDPYRLTLNCYDSSYTAGGAGFTVNGGTFENFDPRNNPAEGTGTSFVAEGVGINKDENGNFTAKSGMAAQIVDADGNSVAAYAGHYDAIAAAKDGEKVILLSDRKNFVTNTINANITIDLNGKTLSVGNNNPFFRTNGEVTIQNGTISSDYRCVIVNAYNKLTLKNVKITSKTDNGWNLVNVCSNAEVTIDKDTVLTATSGTGAAVFVGQEADAKYTLNVYGKVIQEAKSFAISGNGSYKGTTTINIYDGAEVKSASVAIYQPQAGAINVYGGLVEGYCAIGIKSGSLNIKGGTVRGTANDNLLDDSNSVNGTISYDGSAIVVDSRSTGYAGNVKINVTGGTVESYYSTAIREIGEQGKTDMTQLTKLNVIGGSVLGASKNPVNVTSDMLVRDISVINISVSGGTFKHAIPEEYCADGFIPTQNDDGTYGVKEGKYVAQIGDVKYETLEEAFAAAKNGDTITLLEDCKSDRINLEDKSVTVVLNGKTLTSTAAYGVMFCAKNGNKITIDGTVEGSKLVGTLMITSGTDGHIEVNGGTYESNQYCPIYVNGAVSSENSTVTVKNAIIKATNISSKKDDSGCAVYLAGYSTSVFENCTITAPITGIEIRAGKLTLNNCDVTGGNGEVTEDANGNGTTVTNAALAISQHTTKKPIEVTISGGTFNGTAAVYQTDVQGTGSADVKIAVKSGTFNGTISGETDGTIAISGGKFKVKVDDKYFDGNHACSTDTTDGYYTVAGHPITKVGLTLGEDISIRIVVDAKYKDGKIKVTYETYDPNTKGMVTKELIINKCEYAGLDEEGNKKYQFRISNVTPQMADVVFTLQYLDSEGNKIGSAKQISIVEYCRKFAETNKFEAYKAKIGQLLNYCATAMDFRAVSHKDDMYNGLSWAKRATALRAKISEFGYTVADIDFGKVGQYSNAAIENIVTGFGIEFAESIKLYYFTAPDNYKDGYTYVADGLLTPVPVYEDGVLIGYRVYLTVAMDGYHAKRTLKVYDANGEEVQRIGMAPDYALKYLYNSDKQTTEFKQLCKAAYQYFIAFAE